MDRERFVFRDPHGSRWRRFSRGAVFLSIALSVGLVLFMYALSERPRLEPLPATADLGDPLQAGNPPGADAPRVAPRAWLRQPMPAKPAIPHPAGDFVRLGFLDEDLARAKLSWDAHAEQLTHVAPAWLHLSGMPPRLELHADAELQAALAQHSVGLIPMLSNLVGEHYDPEAVEHYLHADADTQQAFAEALVVKLRELDAKGVLIAWEQVDPTYQNELTAFIERLHSVLHADGLSLWLNIPVGDDSKPFDLDHLAAHAEHFVATLYYETGEEDLPGPIASQRWFQEWLEALTQHGDPAQWVIGLGNFGHDWPNGAESETIAFHDVMARAASAKVREIVNVPPYDGPRFTYREHDVQHTVWFLDASTFHNQYAQVLARHLGGVAIDRLGTEDPAVWPLLNCSGTCNPIPLEIIPPSAVVATIGQGDFLQVRVERANGRRIFPVDTTGVWGVRYLTLPRTPNVTRSGAGQPNQVALTFDDGPDPEWTPQILDVLQAQGVQATFFVMGEKASAYPELIRRILDEGHELGNHTFSHPDLREDAPWRVRLELNATQRAIESITGRSTLLFRPPYDADRTPHTASELEPLLQAQQLGYVPTMASIDPLDWQRPEPEEILRRIKAQRLRGSVILLHDGGGDRTQTLAALPLILDYLHDRDDVIVPLHVLLDTPREAVNPPISAADPTPQRMLAGTGLSLFQLAKDAAWIFLFLATALLLLRTFFVVGLAWRHARREQQTAVAPTFTPAVSVVLAAYNEATLIAHTLNALLNSDYPGELEIILVDDGSQDRTADIVSELATHDARLHLLRQTNTGKAQALQAGLAQARHAYIVMLDADTQFQANTMTELLRPLQDARVGAVSGTLRVGNSNTWITRFQALEYIAGFNLDRRAYDALEAITVVPGAASAYSTTALVAAGGIQTDTLAEDTDLTLSLHRAGYLIRHASRAQAYTEAPNSLRTLLRQRKRWSFGTLQCLWKHRSLLFNPRYAWLGLFAIPSVWFFHLLLVVLVPFIDLALIIALINGADSSLLIYALAFMGVDLLLAGTACWLDGEPLRSSWRVLPMRVLYRPLLSLAVLYSLQRALRGSWVSWGVQERWGIFPRLRSGNS